MICVKLMYQISKNSNNSFNIVGRYDYIILKKMYEHILDEDITRECGIFLYSKNGMKDMLRLHNFIDEIITYCTTSTKETRTIITELRYYHYQG